MKKLFRNGVFIAAMIYPAMLFAQNGGKDMKTILLDSLSNPNRLNSATAQLAAALQNRDTSLYNFVRQLNLKFKTFQAGSLPPGLGFSYQYDNSWTKKTKVSTQSDNVLPDHNFSQSFNLNLDGNVAFKSICNPVNFLESKFIYNGAFFGEVN